MPFLDTLIVRRDDCSVKLLVYRKSTHTDQYLNFKSHHPLDQKLGVVRTLIDRSSKIVTEDTDKATEATTIKEALQNCGYSDWSFNKVKQQMQAPKRKKATKNKEDGPKSFGLAVIPYVESVSERVARVCKSYNIATAMKPYCTLRQMLVHWKDKRDPLNTTEVIYCVPCKNSKETYIGETGRKFGKRLEEHRAEAEKVATDVRTIATKQASQSKKHKSAITDHVVDLNHVIDWEEARIIS